MNLDVNEIMELIDKVNETGLDTLEYQDEDIKLKIKGGISSKEQSAAEGREKKAMPKPEKKKTVVMEKTAKPVKETVVENGRYIESPLVGTFYHAPAEGAEPFVTVGSSVKKGQVVGIVEAMKLMNEIQSDVDGIVEEILVPNETLVEFGQKLIRVSGC